MSTSKGDPSSKMKWFRQILAEIKRAENAQRKERNKTPSKPREKVEGPR